MERYARHLDLIGAEGQRALSEAGVLVVGTGGLGSPALLGLAAAGVGRIGLVDADTVELSNLNRQLLHSDEFIGRPKTESAYATLSRFNPEVALEGYTRRFDEGFAADVLPEYDLMINCVDNYASRRAASAACTRLNKPLIEGGIEGMSGFVQIVVPGRTACFNCFGAEEPEIYRQVLGTCTGVIGNLQALEGIRQLTGQWDGSYSYVAVNFQTLELDRLLLEPNAECGCCAGGERG